MADIFDLFRKIGTAETDQTPISYLIVGLGNPGKEYEGTRHNIGFHAVDALAASCGVRIDRVRFHALTATATLGGRRVLLMKPQTYMNNSGLAVSEALRFYKLPPENLIVLCDDISFEPGIFRIRRKGSAGGHNGLKSIIAQIGSQDFPRLKMGVGAKPTPDYDLADWVLSRFPVADRPKCDTAAKNAVEAVTLITEGKIDLAMAKFSK